MDTSTSSQQGGNNDSIILEEEIDPNYVPTEEEVEEYATWMGMDPVADRDLFWIAREGLMAPLPKNWKPCKTKDSGDIYYFNFQTSESSWDHPCDGYYKRLYEEEKRKKETQKKVESDTVRAKARQDVDQLLGRGGDHTPSGSAASSSSSSSSQPKKKSSSSSNNKAPSKSAVSVATSSLGAPKASGGKGGGLPPSGGLNPLVDKKALPGIRGKDLPQARPLTAPAAISTSSTRGGSSMSVSASSASSSFALGDFDDSDSSPQQQHRGRGGRDSHTDDSGQSSKRVTSRLRSSITESETYKSPVIAKAKSSLSTITSLTASFPGSSAPPSSSSESKDGPGSHFLVPRSKAPLGSIGTESRRGGGSGGAEEEEAKGNGSVRKMSGKAEEDDEWRADSRSYDARRENNELQILLDENAKLKESLSLSQAECDDLKSKLASISQSLDKESKTNEALLSAQNMLQMQSNSLKEESKALRTELNKEIERRTKQDAELKEVQQQWSNTKKENEVHKKTIGELKERLHTAECEISQLSTPALNRSASSAIKNEDSDRELENLLMRIRGEKNDVERALVGAEKSLVAMKAERDSLSEQLERLRLVSQQRAARLEQDAEDARREAVSHRSLNSDLTAKLTASQKMLDEIRSRPMAAVSTTEFNIDSSMNYKLSDLQLELEGERAKSNRLESQISAMRQELADMDSQLAQSRRRSTELEDRCNSTDFACRSLESKLALEMAAHQQLNAQLRSREEDVRNLERAVDAKETAQLSSQEEIAQLRVQCVELEKQLSALSTKARDEPNSAVSNSSNADIVVRLEAAQVRLVQLEADLRDERRRVSFLEAELAQKQQWADRSAESERNAKSSLYEALNKIRDLQAESDAMKALLVRSSESRQVNDSVSVGSSADVLQSRLVDAEHQIQSLSLRASRLEEDLIVSRRDAETADRLRRDLDASLVTAKEQISALRSEQLQDKTILFETQLLLERGQRKIVALESELSDALRENTLNKENHRSQRENLEKRLLEIASRKDAEVLKLQDDVARERANAEAHRSEELVLQHRTQQLEAQIAVLTREKCELFSRCEELSSIQEQPVATTPVASSDASVDSLRNTLHEKQREIVALHARIRSLEEENRRLATTLDSRSAECERLRCLSSTATSVAPPIAEAQSTAAALTSIMESYKAQMDAALKEQQEATAALRARIEVKLQEEQRNVPVLPQKSSSSEQRASSPPRRSDVRLDDGFDSRSIDSYSSGAESDLGAPPPKGLGTPIATLRRKLSLYAKQHQDFGQLEGSYMEVDRLSDRISKERKLIDEIRQFIRSENNYIRRKQRRLAAERERWRSLYHSNRDATAAADTDAFRAAKKTSRDALNKRAESINRMVDQIRKVQGWLEVREAKLIRLESMASSVGRLRNNGEASFLDHMKILNALNYELENDLTAFRDEDFGSAQRFPVVFGPRSSINHDIVVPNASNPTVGHQVGFTSSFSLAPRLHASAIFGNRLGQSYRVSESNYLKPLENHTEWLEKLKRDISSFQPHLSETPWSSEFLAHTNLMFSKKENYPHIENEVLDMVNKKIKSAESEQKKATFKV